jgi:hypothetical protein
MRILNLFILLVLSEVRNAGLEKRIRAFESLVKILSNEIDRQREEIESMKRQSRFKSFNPIRRVA